MQQAFFHKFRMKSPSECTLHTVSPSACVGRIVSTWIFFGYKLQGCVTFSLEDANLTPSLSANSIQPRLYTNFQIRDTLIRGSFFGGFKLLTCCLSGYTRDWSGYQLRQETYSCYITLSTILFNLTIIYYSPHLFIIIISSICFTIASMCVYILLVHFLKQCGCDY